MQFQKLGEPNRRVMRIGRSSAGEEMSVYLPIKLNGESLSALLDSGAGPSVIDLHTLRTLGLESELNTKSGKIFGISQDPVEIVGTVQLELDLGNEQTVTQSFQVLSGTHDTCILGRDLLVKFGTTEFDWLSHQIRLGPCGRNRLWSSEEGNPS